MNKAEFISMVAAKAGTSKKDSEANLNAILAVISDNLAKGEDVPFIGFGTFKVVKRPERMGRNPSTGAAIKIPATTADSERAKRGGCWQQRLVRRIGAQTPTGRRNSHRATTGGSHPSSNRVW